MNLKGRQFSIFRFFSDFCFSSPPGGTWCYKTLEKKFTQINNFLKRFTFLQTLDVIYGFPLIISIFFSFYLQKYFGCGGKGTLSPAHPVAAILAGGAGRRLGRRWVEFSDWSKTSDVHHLEKRRLHLLVTIYFPSFRPPFSSYLFKEMVNLKFYDFVLHVSHCFGCWCILTAFKFESAVTAECSCRHERVASRQFKLFFHFSHSRITIGIIIPLEG